MSENKCLNCGQKKNCQDSFTAWVFFVIGLVATLAIRLVTVLININPLYGKVAWYIGVVGFLIFFINKFNVNSALAKIIDQKDLINKAKTKQPLSDEEYGLISTILCNSRSEKERINYFFIFAVSALAFVLAIYFDFLR
ncbi:hypothetical protein A2291_01220 [candidate division WOR-1 bacterium RIFOXYB2_FULL_42_35]|uniref:Uncharacterized protein n=1 Tax=candidate division WOR-1 bacterium RIFOXYC2_FULL_41_25 TaxID=1802586 RepID=A0A1F4TL12_UNCSA|nr:MAG: hypothetical protein A2247_04645 [candidate division WOR-1 bacterium RIFOXYA2_FULL_41_14]OGC22927.1 MAG: hypothetical protein A2291_01220 [candidate division WOR-1 bacterium RIFOXYB2_FULL_42_35]OGC33408.1 MAG: hypothetical protein A2462_06610 [candidate division WOR-1 bacterium RIFOXYC2_FULL_41_25]OGC43464.1 MAG: hypothetical protein A2548_06770 [candidate division WOR-1 bacterium RIFOXYD2_FULL_41_8]